MYRFNDVDVKKRVFAGVSITVYLICAILYISELVSFSFNGFGVDSSGKLYVGLEHKIDVYEGGKKINTIRNGTDRGFEFTIQRDDTILLTSAPDVYIMDLQGENILEHWTDDSGKIKSKLRREKYTFQVSTGEIYTASRPLGMLTIRCEGKVIYRMPIFDYIIMILFIISMPCFFISIVIAKKEMEEWLKGA